ncbi:MAG: putative toxin-antitoxin system toxin component, PIN family [Polaromonas sp.]|nr:putative toxin-antitoxin system toxin component, PIN family [Polaromonas sp.]MDP2449842.1 putative toxin-antitoxin system toxin component, PIN family [Polaromonas sp.]MDP3246300.1 putative toxin-antitoxin system toxin component, PIN family [Polaromonas sp.]MDP3754274.1 putative toxin-antitoxin system toxin component, PIN family [Polaromonas sp.]MDP3828110.1 putative toxin-antitoxin system toxin component, PIN family [Polaromonas sp.]
MDTQARVGDCVVLDTNIVLDLFVFGDLAAQALKSAVVTGQLQWLATDAMRVELERVLDYPQVAKRMTRDGLVAAQVLLAFDTHARTVAAGSKAPVTCSDADDQIFIDLAVAHHAWLLSKDQAVLCMKKKLLALGVRAQSAINLVAI